MKKFITNLDLEKLILLVIGDETRPIPRSILLKKVIVANKHQSFIPNDLYDKIINKMIDNGLIKELKVSKKLVIGYVTGEVDTSKTYEGVIRINHNRFGFITLCNEQKAKYFVHRINLNGALNNDRVKFQVVKNPRQDSVLIDAVVTEIIQHEKDFYVCVFNIKDGKYSATPDDTHMYYNIILDDIEGLVNDQKILVKIKKYEKENAYGHVAKIIGHKSDVGIDILSIVLDNGVEPDFSDDLLDSCRKLKVNLDDKQKQIRRDLTNLPIVTIDPKTSKDFDDAICVIKQNNTYKLYVCIADVAHYVNYQSELDKTAMKRGCSIYLADRVIPMLPHILSDDVCSLNYDVVRLTMTCEMIINNEGKVIKYDVYPSYIKSWRRFNYGEVNDFFDNKTDFKNEHHEIKQMLLHAKELHNILNKARFARGYINFAIPEPEILLDETGFPIQIKLHETGLAQNMIENFMLQANECVTLFAYDHKIPFIYRVHDKPNEEKIKSMIPDIRRLNFKIPNNLKDIKPKDISNWFENNKDNPNLDLISVIILRCLAKAKYDTNNIGHFGLALQNYTHFTSPIRRYPDLIVARLFWMYIFDREHYNDVQRSELASHLKEITELSSKNELIAIQCERCVNAMKFAEYMTKHIGEEFIGFVSSVSSFGVFVELDNTIEGLIKLENLKNDFYVYNEKTNELIGKTKGLRFCLGTKVKVKVITADKLTRKINFELVEHLGNR